MSVAAASLGSLNFQINWIPDATYAGIYIAAQNGYFKDAGFAGATVLPGGSDIAPDPVVATGKALIGISGPDSTALANAAGAGLRIIGATFQRNPYVILSTDRSPIRTPADLKGKAVAVDATSQPIWDGFLKANNLDPSSVNTVPGNYDLSPLVNGSIDAYLGYVTNEPNALAQQGITPTVLLLDEHGLASVGETVMVETDSIMNNRAGVVAALAGAVRGYRDALTDSDAAAALTFKTYGADAGLDEAFQRILAKNLVDVFVTDETKLNGLLTITDARQADVISTLAAGGTTTTVADLFDLTLLADVYTQHPELKVWP